MDIETLALCVTLGPSHSFKRVLCFGLSLYDADGKGLGHVATANTEQIVGATDSLLSAAFRTYRFNRSRRLKA